MQQKIKQGLSLLLALCLLLTAALSSGYTAAATIVASGDCGVEGDNVKWSLDSDGILTISGSGNMQNYSYPSFAPWYSFRSGIKRVTIHSGVTSIGSSAFRNCEEMTDITISDSVLNIAENAFFWCRGLTEITIPNSVKALGDTAFDSCTGLISIVIPDSVVTIGMGTFVGCTGLKHISIGSSVTKIGASAFFACVGLTSIVIPENVISIEDGAFCRCSGLTKIEVDTKNTAYFSVNNCLIDKKEKALIIGCNESVIPTDGSVIKIEKGAFENCTGLKSIIIPDSVTSIGVSSFSGCTGLSNITISSNVKIIEHSAFYNCSGLTNVTIPEGVTTIGNSAFSGCSGLKNVTLPSSVESIDYAAFNGCKELTGIEIPDKVTIIEERVFANCSKLTDITLPSGLKQIKNEAFFCTNLTSITIPDGLTSIGSFAFNGSQLKTIRIPKSVSYIGDSAICSSTGLTSITVDKGNPIYHSSGNCLIQTEEKLLIAGCKNSVIPTDGSVIGIAPNVFNSCTGLTDIIIPTGVIWIEEAAFYRCSDLTSISLPDTIKNIGIGAFGECANLADIYYASSKEDWKKITVSEGNAPLFDSTIHFNSVGPEKTIYNLGDETYSFENYEDEHAVGHCHGMSATSAGYYLDLLDSEKIGINAGDSLYSAAKTKTVTDPICYYHKIQGGFLSDAIVAGGNMDYKKDWRAVLDYVKNHAYDGSGQLEISIRLADWSGHALNFLRYENVNGQDRIYAYDSYFPDDETYFYLTDTGIRQGPSKTYYSNVDIAYIALIDVAAYFENAGSYDSTHALYAQKGQISVEGITGTVMLGASGDTPWLMYEFPANVKVVTITPQTDNATFTYIDKEYSFGAAKESIYATLTLSTSADDMPQETDFVIHEETGATVPGDVSGDGAVTAEDARLALRATVGLENYDKGSAEFLAADADKSGTLEAADARMILRAAVGLETLD